jgi:hypothetical protein
MVQTKVRRRREHGQTTNGGQDAPLGTRSFAFRLPGGAEYWKVRE